MKRILSLITIITVALFLMIDTVSAETLKIGAIFAKTGEAASSNMNHIQGVRFSVEELNKKGGILGRKIELVEFDNHSTPIQSKLAAKKAVRAKVAAVIGASWSSHSLAVAPVLQKAGIPMVSPDSTNPKVTAIGNYIFRACFIDPFQGQILADFAHRQFNAKTAVVITDITSAYSLGLGEAFKKSFQSYKGDVLADLGYKLTERNFSSILKNVKLLNPDVLFVPGHDESGFIVKQAQEIGISSIMLGGDGWAYRMFLSNGGQELKEGYFSTHWSQDVNTKKSKEFVKRFSRVYEISPLAAISYDAVMLLADAIERAGSSDRAKIRDSLASTKNFEGVTGQITMNWNGDPNKSIVIMKITEGKTTYYKTINP